MSRYPWGNQQPDRSRATRRTLAEPSLGLRRVCTKPRGNTRDGICDMADNVPEYVDGWVDYSDGWVIRYDSVGERRYFGRMVKGCGEKALIDELWDLCVVGMPSRDDGGYVGARCAKDAEQVSNNEVPSGPGVEGAQAARRPGSGEPEMLPDAGMSGKAHREP